MAKEVVVTKSHGGFWLNRHRNTGPGGLSIEAIDRDKIYKSYIGPKCGVKHYFPPGQKSLDCYIVLIQFFQFWKVKILLTSGAFEHPLPKAPPICCQSFFPGPYSVYPNFSDHLHWYLWLDFYKLYRTLPSSSLLWEPQCLLYHKSLLTHIKMDYFHMARHRFADRSTWFKCNRIKKQRSSLFIYAFSFLKRHVP